MIFKVSDYPSRQLRKEFFVRGCKITLFIYSFLLLSTVLEYLVDHKFLSTPLFKFLLWYSVYLVLTVVFVSVRHYHNSKKFIFINDGIIKIGKRKPFAVGKVKWVVVSSFFGGFWSGENKDLVFLYSGWFPYPKFSLIKILSFQDTDSFFDKVLVEIPGPVYRRNVWDLRAKKVR
ncbi:hypothetical protein DOE51_10255 [Bdellovibrio sp. NC01]|nr:hypothetical protein DOE51_10255 [Bdellovibrio sp. NC01]